MIVTDAMVLSHQAMSKYHSDLNKTTLSNAYIAKPVHHITIQQTVFKNVWKSSTQRNIVIGAFVFPVILHKTIRWFWCCCFIFYE